MLHILHNIGLVAATSSTAWECVDVNASRVSPFCASTAKPMRVCSDTDEPDYHTQAEYEKQAGECSSARKRKEQCDNDASRCKPLTKGAYCGARSQPCKHASSCLSYCWADCFPCNERSDCDLLVAFGIAAAAGEPCWSLMNSSSGRAVLPAAVARLRAKTTTPRLQHTKKQPPRRAFYSIFAAMLDAPEWPAAYEEYRGGVVIMQPHNATKSTVDAVRRALDVKVLMYFDATDLKLKLRGECAPGAPPQDCNVSGAELWTRCSSGAIACCTSYNCSAFDAPTCAPDAFDRALAEIVDPGWAIHRLHASSSSVPICWYGFGPLHVHSKTSTAALVPFLARWVEENGFDGLYIDEFFQEFPGKTYLGKYPEGTLFDADGDGRADSVAEIEAMYVRNAPRFSFALRNALGNTSLGEHALLIANTGGALVDAALNGITIEACDDEAQCAEWFAAQAAVAHAPPLSVMWLKGSSPEECATAARLRKRFPFLLEGTDFYDGTHVVCNNATSVDAHGNRE